MEGNDKMHLKESFFLSIFLRKWYLIGLILLVTFSVAVVLKGKTEPIKIMEKMDNLYSVDGQYIRFLSEEDNTYVLFFVKDEENDGLIPVKTSKYEIIRHKNIDEAPFYRKTRWEYKFLCFVNSEDHYSLYIED